MVILFYVILEKNLFNMISSGDFILLIFLFLIFFPLLYKFWKWCFRKPKNVVFTQEDLARHEKLQKHLEDVRRSDEELYKKFKDSFLS